jgi:phosphoglycolate phosphatase
LKTVVFDLDGTLIDSLPDIASACNTMLAAHGYPQHETKSYQSMIGWGVRVLVQKCLPFDYPEEEINDLEHYVAEVNKNYHEHPAEKSTIYPGILEMLEKLKNENYRLGICTNKPHSITMKVVEALFPPGLFERVQGQDWEFGAKPDPAMLISVMDELGYGIFVGDSEVDLQSAKNASVDCVLVSWGYRELLEADAKICHTGTELYTSIVELSG